MYRVINKNKYIERNLCVTLVIYQESLLATTLHRNLLDAMDGICYSHTNNILVRYSSM